jgi:hypothetical protein
MSAQIMRPIAVLLFCVALLGACGRTEETASDVAAGKANEREKEPTDEVVALAGRLAKLDQDALIREIAPLEYLTQRELLTFSGLEQQLGGPQLADAALHALMMEVKRLHDKPRPDLVQWMRVQTPQTANGTLGVGLSALELVLVSRGSAELTDANAPGNSPKTSTTNSEHGSSETTVTRDTVSHTSSTEGMAMGLNAKILTQMKVNVCPDADGKIVVEMKSKSSLSVPSGGGGANTTLNVVVTRYVDDDARFRDEYDTQTHVEQAVFGGGGGTYVDMDIAMSSRDGGSNGVRVNRRSSQATDATVQATAELSRILLGLAHEAASNTRPAWESGRCVKLNTTTTPSKRTGLKPSTQVSMLAMPRSQSGGGSVGGTVRATLSGDKSISPENSKVNADATFDYVAPGESSKQATVSLEARSKRGVAKEALTFNTGGTAYSIDGGADEFHGTGVACDIAQPFDVKGSGVVVKFTPSSAQGGSYSYTGNMSGFAVWGNGTYIVMYQDEVAVAITATGPGSVKTPMGTRSNTGSEKYTLVPASGQTCNN